MFQCKATQDGTGAYTCYRCGTQWDADDTKPKCRTREQIHDAKHKRKKERRKADKHIGLEAIKTMREDLNK